MGLTAVIGQVGIEERGFAALQSEGNSLPPPTRNTVQAVHTVCPSKYLTLMKLCWILFHLILYKQHHQHLPLLLHCHLPLANFDALYHQRHHRHLALHPRRCHQRCLLPRPRRGGLRSGDDIGQAHRLRRRHPPPHQ
ncbi:unnamed protein product [Arctia plantaginis]|uniref:Uncharacterized protein n=1 Tax=Arctia plantaginis TaxID=874455 RepID=A0A8S1B487_ARCPL|nr:unnamed protein product [Arctia plantaginis]